MKFRDFVGDDEEIVVRPKKKPVHVAKPQTAKKILKDLDIETYYFGYALSKIQLKRFFDYFRSWFVRYDIPFSPVNPSLTLCLLTNVNKYKFINRVKDVRRPKIYPLGTVRFENGLYIDYVMNPTFESELSSAFGKEVDLIGNMCYVKIFELGKLNQKLMEDMTYSMPKIPYLVLGNPIITRS